jgi:hypothetical protein
MYTSRDQQATTFVDDGQRLVSIAYSIDYYAHECGIHLLFFSFVDVQMTLDIIE